MAKAVRGTMLGRSFIWSIILSGKEGRHEAAIAPAPCGSKA